jgi:hypothetical protein
VDPTKVQTTHPSNITGVKPGTGTNKSSDNTSTKYNGSKTRNWTLQKFRQHVPVPGFTPVIFGGCVV